MPNERVFGVRVKELVTSTIHAQEDGDHHPAEGARSVEAGGEVVPRELSGDDASENGDEHGQDVALCERV